MFSLNLCFAQEVLWNSGLRASALRETPHAVFREQISCYLSPLLLPIPTWSVVYERFPCGILLTVSAIVTNAFPHLLAPRGLLSLFFLARAQP